MWESFGERLPRLLDPDGTLDASFGQKGWASVYFSGLEQISYNALALQPDGKIIVAGYGTDLSGEYRLIVVRLLANGQKDVSFNLDGVYVGDVFNEIALAAAIQPDGNILVAGYVYGGWFGPSRLLIIRLKPNGTLDNSFGVNGNAYLQINNQAAYPYDIDLLPDGRILLAGRTVNSAYEDIPFVARFLPGGMPDHTFGGQGDGIVTTLFEGSIEAAAYDLAVRPNGAVVIAGNADGYLDTDTGFVGVNGFFMAQYGIDGVLDTAFNRQGTLLQNDDENEMMLAGITLQPDGKIIGVGEIRSYAGEVPGKWTTWRFLPNGEPDDSWGEAGQSVTEMGDFTAAAVNVFWLPEGKILVAGFASNGQDYDVALVRYFPGTLISTVEKPGQVPALRVQSPVTDRANIWYTLKDPTVIRLNVLDAQGKIITALTDDELQASGTYQREIPVAGLPAGWYVVVLQTKQGVASQVMIKL